MADELIEGGDVEASMTTADELSDGFSMAFFDLSPTVPEELQDDVTTLRNALLPLVENLADNDNEAAMEVVEDLAEDRQSDGGVPAATTALSSYSQEQCGFTLAE